MRSHFIDREESGLRPPRDGYPVELPTQPATMIVVHHGASAAPQHLIDRDGDGAPDQEELIWLSYQDHHMDVKGWSDIAYSFGFGITGARYEGRGWGWQSGATGRPHDTFSVSFCAIGNFDTKHPSDELLDAMAKQAFNGMRRGHLVKPGQLVWIGHKDKPHATACPGRHLYPRIPEVAQEAKRLWRKFREEQQQPEPPAPPVVIPVTLETLDQRLKNVEEEVFG